MPSCAHCGAEIRSGARFCSSCGNPRPGNPPDSTDSARLILGTDTPAIVAVMDPDSGAGQSTRPGTRSSPLGNVLIAAATAVMIAFVTLGLDRVLGNAPTYFTADIVIAVATGVALWGGLVLLDRWERRKSR